MMTTVGEARGGSRSIAWTDALGAWILMILVMAGGGLGLGLAMVNLLGLLGMPVDTGTMSVLHDALVP